MIVDQLPDLMGLTAVNVNKVTGKFLNILIFEGIISLACENLDNTHMLVVITWCTRCAYCGLLFLVE